MGAWLHFEVSFMVWILIGALGIAIADEFSLSATEKGLLVSVPLLGGALLRILVGPLADQFGAKTVGLYVLGVETLALFLGWRWSTSYEAILGIGLLLGAAGSSFAIALPIASQAYPPQHQGLAMGVAAVGNSGVLLASFFAPRVAQAAGWHNTFGFMLVPVLLTICLFSLIVQPSKGPQPFPRSKESSVNVRGLLRQAIGQRYLYWLCFLYAVTFGGFVGLSSFLPIFFHDQYQITMVTAGTMTALCALSGSLARPIGGHLADRFGGTVLLQVVFLLLGLCCIALGYLLAPQMALPLLILTLGLLGFGNGVVFQVVSIRFRRVMGTASGLIGAAGGLGGFLLPFWFGVLKDTIGSFAAGFWVLGGVAVLAGVSVIMVQRSVPLPSPGSVLDGG